MNTYFPCHSVKSVGNKCILFPQKSQNSTDRYRVTVSILFLTTINECRPVGNLLSVLKKTEI